MAPPPTKHGTPKLSEIARKVVAPEGIVSTAWPSVESVCRDRLGVSFDPWQQAAGRLILAKRADGKLAAMIGGIGMSLPRQVGKTYLIGSMVFALGVLRPGMLVIWSAHHARTHGETFLSMQNFAARSKVKPYIEQVFKGSGDEEIRFRNGSRILFGARERGFGRGIPGVDMIVSDEAQIMSDKALDAQLATMNTSDFGLAIYVGTPPRPDDPSEAFTRMRTEAWDGTLRDAAWVEFGADSDAKPTDRAQWAKANPSYPRRTPVESMLRLQRKLTPESFMREGLGVWDPPKLGNGLSVEDWQALGPDEGSRPEDWPKPSGRIVLGVDASPRLVSASIVAYGDGVLELLEHRAGTSWLAARVAEIQRGNPDVTEVAYDRTGPVAALLPDFERESVDLTDVDGPDSVRAVAAFIAAVNAGTVRHRGEHEFTAAVAGAQLKPVGDGNKWSRRNSTVDITPLVAATNAMWTAANVEQVITPTVHFL